MEVYCVQVEYQGERASDNWNNHTLYSSLKGAKQGLKNNRDSILKDNPWLNNEDCIDTDDDRNFFVHDDQESYEITINKEPVHE